jgi:hypothetical protein
VILSSTSYWKTELAFSAMILLSLMAIVLFAAVSLIERLACPWLAPEGEAWAADQIFLGPGRRGGLAQIPRLPGTNTNALTCRAFGKPKN